MRTGTGSCVRAGILAVAIAVLLAVPAVCAGDAPKAPQVLETTLERLSELLGRLGAELAAVDRPAADRLEERVGEAADLVENVLAGLDENAPAATPQQIRERLDAALHRLVVLLEEIVGKPEAHPERDRARATLEEVRSWVDGYVTALTAGMDPREAAKFERAAQDLARALAAHLADVARRAPADGPADGRLVQVISRLETLTQKLDELLARRAAKEEPSP